MKTCPNCGAQLADDAAFCPNCGTACAPAAGYQGGQQPPQQPQQQAWAYQVNPYDHTGEYNARDISDNKVICMTVYLMGTVGIIIAMLASSSSPYVAFHVRQALKLTVVSTLTTLATLLLFWTLIVPIAGGIFMVVLFVIRIICFFNICSGKAVEPPLVRSLGFLR